MSQATAERWVIISALLVAGIYAYRRLTNPVADKATARNLLAGPAPTLGSWATAWGMTFLMVSIIAEANPGLGGAFAISIAVADFLANGQQLFTAVGKQESAQAQSQATTQTGAAQVAAGQANPNLSKGGVQIAAGTVTQGLGRLGSQVSTRP